MLASADLASARRINYPCAGPPARLFARLCVRVPNQPIETFPFGADLTCRGVARQTVRELRRRRHQIQQLTLVRLFFACTRPKGGRPLGLASLTGANKRTRALLARLRPNRNGLRNPIGEPAPAGWLASRPRTPRPLARLHAPEPSQSTVARARRLIMVAHPRPLGPPRRPSPEPSMARPHALWTCAPEPRHSAPITSACWAGADGRQISHRAMRY